MIGVNDSLMHAFTAASIGRFDQVGGNDLGRAIATEVTKRHLRRIRP